VEAAKAHRGVVAVMTPANRPPLAEDPDAKTNPFMFRFEALQNDRVRYANQSIAVVIAETLEAATEGAALLAPRYDAEPARTGLDSTDNFVPAAIRLISPPEALRCCTAPSAPACPSSGKHYSQCRVTVAVPTCSPISSLRTCVAVRARFEWV